MPNNTVSLPARGTPISTRLLSDATHDQQDGSGWTDAPWTQVPHEVACWGWDFVELVHRDQEKKMQMKAQAEGRKGEKTSDIQVRDAVLPKQ